jgi:TRAP-type C4-dicarboxylate transport system permease small subunit
MRSFIRLVDTTNKGLSIFCGLALAGMTFLIFLQVLVRFVFAKLHIQFSVPWTEELSRYLMIWAVFVGAAVIARHADALAVEALVLVVPPPVGRAIKFSAHGLALVFYGCIFAIGLDWLEFGRSEDAPVLGMHMAWVYASMSVGAALTIINAVALLAEVWLDKKDILDVIDHEADEAVEEMDLSLAPRKA